MNQQVLVRTVIIGSSSFAVLLLALHLVQPNLDPTWSFISEYARGSFGWLMSLAFIALAAACVSGAVLFWKSIAGWAGRIGSGLLGVSSIGMVLAALFVTDPINTPMDQLTTSGTLHSIGGQLNFTSFAVLFLTIGLRKNGKWRSIKKPLWVTTIICLLADVAFIATAASSNGVFGPGVYTGLFGRIIMISFVVWMIIASTHVMKSKSNRDVVS